jgi:hypothetical protein
MLEALLVLAAARQLPPTLTGHVAACRECAAHWRRLLAASRLFTLESAYSPRLRARTLARVAADRERASASPWLWFTPAALVSMIAAYAVPAWVLSGALATVLDSSTLATVAALLFVGSLFVLLPAGLAVSLLRRAPEVNGAGRFEEKGVSS